MKKPEKIAEQLFIQFCEGYKNRDLPLLLSLFTKNANMWGSAIDEYREGLAAIEMQFKRDWSQSEHCEMQLISFAPTSQDAVWTAGLCKAIIIANGQTFEFENLRGTVIIEKEDGQWKIAHMHASFPDSRNAENSSFPLTKVAISA